MPLTFNQSVLQHERHQILLQFLQIPIGANNDSVQINIVPRPRWQEIRSAAPQAQGPERAWHRTLSAEKGGCQAMVSGYVTRERSPSHKSGGDGQQITNFIENKQVRSEQLPCRAHVKIQS